MDPITIIMTALASGAAAGLKPTAEKAIKDAYEGIKKFIKKKYSKVSVDMLENDPSDVARQEVVKKDLEKVDASSDADLLRQAKVVLEAVQQYAPETASAVGVSLEDIKGASLTIDDIIASGTGVSVKKAEFEGDIKISGVRAGNSEEEVKKKL